MAEPVVDVAQGRPAPALGGIAGRYTGYRLQGFAPGVHRGLPGPSLTFVVSLGDPVEIAGMPDGTAPGAHDAFVSGLHEGAATISHDGNQSGVDIELSPFGARALFGVPASALAGTVAHLDDLLGASAAAELVERVRAAPDWPARFAAIDRVLARVARARDDGTEPRPEVVEAWRRLLGTGGNVTVRDLCDELGWSRRHLGERFRDELGLPPKAVARIVRFERARRLLERGGFRTLADVAHAAGYYDHAHLDRDWRDLAGCAPSTWLAEEDLPIVQDADPAGRGE